MLQSTLFASRPRVALAAFFLACSAFACEESTDPVPVPTGIEILSGDNQYTRKGTALENPVRVRVELDGADAPGIEVRFSILEGGGSLSRTTATTDAFGETSVRWTVGPDTGNNRLRISTADNTLSVVATATSSEFYCPEEDPTFVRKFTAQHNLFLLTRASSLLEDNGIPTSGLVHMELNFPGTAFDGTAFTSFNEDVFINVVKDCVFATNGDFYVSRNASQDEIVRIEVDGSQTHFATLETFFGAEIAMTPEGILVGCDEFGPFAVTCRDTLTRFEGTLHDGNYPDAANNDAVAVDPSTGDLYYISLLNRRLWRVPLDANQLAGAPVDVLTLPREEADNANGMVVDGTDGSVYILIDGPTIKSILKVTSAGVLTTEYDFFARGAGDAAGQQSDLAIDRGFRFLYTLDTKNDVMLLYQLAGKTLSELDSAGDAEAASSSNTDGERVGIDVMP